MAQRSSASTAVVQLLVEFAAVGAMVLLAGTSDEFGKAMLIIMGGFWLMFLIEKSGVLSSVVSSLTALGVNPANAKGGSSGFAVPTNA